MNYRIMDEALNGLDERFIEEHLARREELAAKAGKRAARAEDPAGKAPAARRFGLKRILAAAVAAAAVTAAVFAAAHFGGAPQTSEQEPPAAESRADAALSQPPLVSDPAQNTVSGSETVGFIGCIIMGETRFKPAFDDSDMVAHVRVLEKTKDSEFTTFFKGELVEVFKGDEEKGSIIDFVQPGGTKMLFGMPLFEYGEEYLLYMRKIDDYYGLNANFCCVADVIYADGDIYYCDRMGLTTMTFTQDTGLDYRNDEELINKLIDVVGADSQQAKYLRLRTEHDLKAYILTEEELIEAFDKIK